MHGRMKSAIVCAPHRMAAIETSVRATAALDDLYRRHVGDVYRYCYAVLGNHADAEDVTQTTFVNALRALERGEEPRNPSNWLVVIAHNIVRQRWRQAAARPAEVELVHDVADRSGDDDVELDGLVRALQRIPPAQREALVMRELEGRSYAEISELLGLTTSALETLLFRARRSLAEELENVVTCQSAELALSQRLDGRLARKDSRRLDEHLAECASCAGMAKTQARQRKAFKGLALLPLPIGLELFRGVPTAQAGSLPTIGVATSSGTASTGAGASGAAAGAGATSGGLAVGGSLFGGVAVKVAAVIVAGVVVTATAYEGAKLIAGKGDTQSTARSDAAVKGAFAHPGSARGTDQVVGTAAGTDASEALTTAGELANGAGAATDSASAATAASDPVEGSDTTGSSGTDPGPGNGSDDPAAPGKGPDGPGNGPSNAGDPPGGPPASPGSPSSGNPAGTRGNSTPGAPKKPKKPKKPQKVVPPVGTQHPTPPQAATPDVTGSSPDHEPPGQAKRDEVTAPGQLNDDQPAGTPTSGNGAAPSESGPAAVPSAAPATTSETGIPVAPNETSAAAQDGGSAKQYGYDKPKK